ncbi:Crp/Fnr family transcriptional regulator [Chryseobacterium sp. JUb7]|uniref:Crp/Fnr family transcriptional regulator n=1 Tax=Chryseobacterium sp. JUb7 TaxID=2940599 RepID=UPI00216AB185|nr:Crp/Fnr family transcriptional regulator [Chryseobacterium sp. JUb7]MCS3531878.1 CRP-like cAMP-binding protein [Chryseobacterium sp. JUb7]
MIICEDLLFSHGAKIQNYTSGEFIFEEGTEPKYYLQIKSGTVKLTSLLEDGREFIHGIPFEGHCIAETYLFNNKSYAINAIAITDCEIIKLEKSKLKDLLQKKPELIFNIYSYTADRMHYRYLTSASFMFQDPLTKLELVMNHMKNYFGFKEKYSFAVPYTRQQLASLTGLRIETVIRTIKKMEKLKIVKLDNSKIYF